MGSRASSNGFVQQHWDWLVAAGGVAAGAAAFALTQVLHEPPEEHDYADAIGAEVKAVSLDGYNTSLERFEKPEALKEIDGEQASFLAAGYRIYCAPGNPEEKGCGKPIVFGVENCPYCGKSQKTDEKPTDDQDGDGMPDEYERAKGLDPADPADFDLDKDGDGFTNGEEFKASTDPADPKSHPDYLQCDRLMIVGQEAQPLKLTFTKFKYTANKKDILEFYEPAFAKDYCKGILSVAVGDEIKVKDQKKGELSTGFILVEYNKKEKEEVIGGGAKKRVDVSEAVIERIKDKKRVTLRMPEKGRKIRETPMDISVKFQLKDVEGEPVMAAEGGKIAWPNVGAEYVVESVKEIAGDGRKRLAVAVRNDSTGETKRLMTE